MKKLDKLILKSFLGPFVLTFAVVEFILLTQYMLKYLDDLVGKDLGIQVIIQLLGYFSLNMVPVALPLAVLLSSLMTFGNLGEHHELTAIKTSGISLLRILRPVFFVALLLSIGAFFFNEKIVPKANLKAYSLLWDIRQKKPSLDIREKIFYNGIPGYSIKVDKKFDDGSTLKGVMIYDHSDANGNTNVILADSGRMYTKFNEQYLALDLFNGQLFAEGAQQGSMSATNNNGAGFFRQKFNTNKLLFNLSSFNLDRTREELFKGSKMMLNIKELDHVTDSLRSQLKQEKKISGVQISPYYTYLPVDSARRATKPKVAQAKKRKLEPVTRDIYSAAANKARNIRSYTTSTADKWKVTYREANNYEIEIYKKYTQSAACLIMFLIGAPLGAIIKKGGLGMPVIISILFFIIYYVLTILGEKWGREGLVLVPAGMWAANLILLPVGFFFLYQARNDSNLLEIDFWRKLSLRLKKNKL
ncbi:LptF/LptG family permease [Adhaeribacter rhizoryzae]|uniref:YjgP/YjgQ family permease n=1 Tax=Adhaeribacter rhizoryzae TaxID=2607907 RepID=A0A5M6DNG1_9BACT|nr:LptF/LptG family permease [Adhaeribacter rhizoryzae]KAA5547720.1 YjgP/YjgQ family permease [Adhaeribacter rhizoryzae]